VAELARKSTTKQELATATVRALEPKPQKVTLVATRQTPMLQQKRTAAAETERVTMKQHQQAAALRGNSGDSGRRQHNFPAAQAASNEMSLRGSKRQRPESPPAMKPCGPGPKQRVLGDFFRTPLNQLPHDASARAPPSAVAPWRLLKHSIAPEAPNVVSPRSPAEIRVMASRAASREATEIPQGPTQKVAVTLPSVGAKECSYVQGDRPQACSARVHTVEAWNYGPLPPPPRNPTPWLSGLATSPSPLESSGRWA
jgi:hypothetical protein